MSRSGVAAVLALLGCLLAGPAVAAYTLNDQIADRDRYVQAVTPIAADPAVRQELTDRVTDAIGEKLTPGALRLPEGVRQGLHSAVAKFVDSDDFRSGWVAANRTIQPEVVAVLRGESSSLRIVGDTVMLDMGVVSDRIKDRLVADGVPLAQRLPHVDALVPLFSRPAIRQAIPAFGLLQDLSVLLPIVAAALVVAGIALSARRRPTVIATGVGLAVSALLVLVYQWISRGQLVSRSESPELAGAFHDAFTGTLMPLLWVLFGVGLAAAAVGFLVRTGGSR
nr:hypothetical protein [Kibdelosporangium sp. MJ126-NF4]CEL17782.1 putative integral membrane protein [Kibdelosporangium sp. MJ126-NF4]CTQ90994.1 putative integral membrane protein [Kibdelosporangium sp. MJ126-NF4]